MKEETKHIQRPEKEKKNENTMIQNLRDRAKVMLRGTYSNKSLSQRKISNKLLNLTPKGTRKEKEQLNTKIVTHTHTHTHTHKDQNRNKVETNKQKVQ